ncbi:MAG: LysR family transcriptional regulator [Clostridia bacterium]|nr:LysR family transcriptional regulator [Clostridia bacterium]
MSTEELKTFIFLSKVKNFTLAAEQLKIAQSTVTNRISELEKEVGKQLFLRVSKTVKLTEEGEIFLRYAERILELQETSIEEMNAVSAHRRTYCIGAINATYELYVKKLVDKCLSNNNETSVKIMLGHSFDLIRALQDNVLGSVFSAVPFKKAGYCNDVYATEPLVLVCAANKNEYPKGITKEQFAKTPYLMCDITLSDAGKYIRSLFPENHIFKLEVDNTSKLIPYLKAGMGYSFLPYGLVREEIEKGELETVTLKGFDVPPMTTYLIYKQNYDVKSLLENKS